VWPELAPRWQEVDGRLLNRRLETVREEANAYSDARREAGKKGGRPKANDKQPESKSEANGKAKLKPSFAVAVPTTDPRASDDAPTESVETWTTGQLKHAALDLLESWRRYGTGSFVDAYHTLSWREQTDIRDALKRRSLNEWEAIFKRAMASDFLSGRDGRFPAMTLWKVLSDASKIVAGVHDNREQPTEASMLAKWEAEDAARAARKAGGAA
jgi:hypothetical protein